MIKTPMKILLVFFLFVNINLTDAKENFIYQTKEKIDFEIILDLSSKPIQIVFLVNINSKKIKKNISEFLILYKDDKPLKPYFISPELNDNLDNVNRGMIIYRIDEFKPNILKIVEDKNVIKLTEANKYEIKIFPHDFSKQEMEKQIIDLTLSAENHLDTSSLINDSLINLFSKSEEFKNEEESFINSFPYYYMMYYNEKYINNNIDTAITYLGKSYSKGNNDEKFLNLYEDEVTKYIDSIFKSNNDNKFIIIEKIVNSLPKEFNSNKLKFYKTYSEYFLIEEDNVYDNKGDTLIKSFNDIIDSFAQEESELKYYSILAIGNICYIRGDYNIAINNYQQIIDKSDVVPLEVKEKAINNIEKAKENKNK